MMLPNSGPKLVLLPWGATLLISCLCCLCWPSSGGAAPPQSTKSAGSTSAGKGSARDGSARDRSAATTEAAGAAESKDTAASAEVEVPSAAERFIDARDRYNAGEAGAVLPIFENLYEETKSPNALLYVARCRRELGELDRAYEAMRATATLAEEAAREDSKYVPTRDAARDELNQLAARVGLLTVIVPNIPSDLEVLVGERRLETAELGSPVPVMPGDVTVRATSSEGDAERHVQLRAGETKTLALTLSADAAEAPAAPLPAVEPEVDQPEDNGLFPWGVVSASVGVAGFTTLAIAGSLARDRFDDLEAECGGQRCDASYQDRVDGGRTMQTVANIGLIVGVVGVAAGATLMVLDWPVGDATGERATAGGESQSPEPHWGLGVSVDQVSVVGSF